MKKIFSSLGLLILGLCIMYSALLAILSGVRGVFEWIIAILAVILIIACLTLIIFVIKGIFRKRLLKRTIIIAVVFILFCVSIPFIPGSFCPGRHGGDGAGCECIGIRKEKSQGGWNSSLDMCVGLSTNCTVVDGMGYSQIDCSHYNNADLN